MTRGRPRKLKEPPPVAVQAEDENDEMDIETSPIETLTKLVQACHMEKATNADVTRLYKARAMLTQIDWTGAECRGLIILLQACVRARIFYRTQYGPHVISAILSAHPALVSLAIKSLSWAVRTFSQPQVKNAGVALFRAWRDSKAGCRILLETAIQKFMTSAVLAAPGRAKRARTLLGDFHTMRSEAGVDELLCRLYQPILWRHLKVANWRIRSNSVMLLSAAFPLILPESSTMEFEAQISRQLHAFYEALSDPSDHVRVSAILAVSHLLSDCWPSIPPDFGAKFFQHLTECNAFDQNSAVSRASVAMGLEKVISLNVMAHVVVRGVIPKIKDLVYDKDAKVRSEVAKLLKTAGTLSRFDLLELFDYEELLELIAVEHAHCLEVNEVNHPSKDTARRLSTLIVGSLFNMPVSEMIIAAAKIAADHPAGFYAALYHYVDQLDWPRMKIKLAVGLYLLAIDEVKSPRLDVTRFRGTLAAIAALVDSCKDVVLTPQDETQTILHDFFYSNFNETKLLEIVKIVPAATPQVLDILVLIDPKHMTKTEIYTKLVRSISSSETPPGLLRLGSAWGKLGTCLSGVLKPLENLAAVGSNDVNRSLLAVKMLQGILLLENPDDAPVIFPAVEKCLRILGERIPVIAAKMSDNLSTEFLDTLLSALHVAQETAPWGAFLAALEKAKPGPSDGMLSIVNCFLPHLAFACFLRKDGGVAEKLGSAMALFWRWAVPGEDTETWKGALNYLHALIDYQQDERIVLEALSHCVQWVTPAAPSENDFKPVANALVKFFDYCPAFKRFLSSPIAGDGDRVREWLNAATDAKRKRETHRPVSLDASMAILADG